MPRAKPRRLPPPDPIANVPVAASAVAPAVSVTKRPKPKVRQLAKKIDAISAVIDEAIRRLGLVERKLDLLEFAPKPVAPIDATISCITWPPKSLGPEPWEVPYYPPWNRNIVWCENGEQGRLDGCFQ